MNNIKSPTHLNWLLIICNRYPHVGDPISGAFVKGQVDALSVKFNKVTVIAMTPYVPNIPIFKRFLTPAHQRDIIAQNYVYQNIEIYFPKPIYFHSFYSKQMASKRIAKWIVKNLFRNNRPDIIHAHFVISSGIVAYELTKFFDIPIVLTNHENQNIFADLMKDSKIQNLLQKFTNIIRVTSVDKNLYETDLVSSKINIIPNGFPSKHFYIMNKTLARKYLNIPTDKFLLLSIGSLTKRKAYDSLIKSYRKIYEKYPNSILTIIGTGPEEKFLKKLVGDYQLSKCVSIVSTEKTIEELNYWYNSADLFILTSTAEGNPTVMFEALSCGLPVITTNVGGVKEILTKESGIVVEKPEDISEIVIRAIEREWDRDRIARDAHQYSWENIAEKIFALYYSTIESKKKICGRPK
ncbi:MAG: glycosyltransferase [Euryarchaeota archaeon]|nr:glycosyltransferase [Euryarchaeota archaeon]